MPYVLSVAFTNSRGETANLYSETIGGEHQPNLVQWATGTGGPGVKINKISPAMTDGSVLNGIYLGDRLLRVEGMVFGETDEERDINMRKLNAILDPRLGEGTITYTDHAGKYTIRGVCDTLPSFQKSSKLAFWKPILIDFLCSLPLWRGQDRNYFRIAYTEGGFRLPFKIPFRLGKQGFFAVVNNPYGTAVPIELRIRGPADKPRLTNVTTGQAIQVNRTLSENELLEIDTYYQTVHVTDLSTNTTTQADGYIDLVASDWIWLEPGDNELRYSSQNDPLRTVVDGFFSDWYIGVG